MRKYYSYLEEFSSPSVAADNSEKARSHTEVVRNKINHGFIRSIVVWHGRNPHSHHALGWIERCLIFDSVFVGTWRDNGKDAFHGKNARLTPGVFPHAPVNEKTTMEK